MEQRNNSELLVGELADLLKGLENIEDESIKEAIINLEKQKYLAKERNKKTDISDDNKERGL